MFYREGLTLTVLISHADCLEAAVKQANDNCFWWIKGAVSHNCYRTRSLFATRSIKIWLFIHPPLFIQAWVMEVTVPLVTFLFLANKVFSSQLRDQCKTQKPDPEKVQTFHHSVTLIKWCSFPFPYIFLTELVTKGNIGGNQHNWEWPVAIFPHYIPRPKILHTLKTPQHTHIHAQGDKQFIRHSATRTITRLFFLSLRFN